MKRRLRSLPLTSVFLLSSVLSLIVATRAEAISYRPGVGPAPFAITIKVMSLIGTGCPAGGAQATLAPDGSSVSILFDKMATELAAGAPSVDKKTCMVRLGLKFDGQYRVAVVGSDARGFVSVPQGGQSRISVQHYSPFTMDQKLIRRMNLTQNFVGPVSDEVALHSDFRDIPMWSSCGTQMRGPIIFPMMSILLTIDSANNNPSENLIASLDSLDIGGPATLTYQLLWTQDRHNCPR